MGKSFFITGTDTGIGKTFVTSLIALTLKERGVDVGVMKPVETGCTEEAGEFIAADAARLKEAAEAKDEMELIAPCRFALPAAPSIAARAEGREITFAPIKRAYNTLCTRHDLLLVEGVGGLLVPINDQETVADLITTLDLPSIIVAGSHMGTINHTLLTVEGARNRGITVAGLIFNFYSKEGEPAIEEITRITGLPVLGKIPRLEIDASLYSIKESLDLSPLLDDGGP